MSPACCKPVAAGLLLWAHAETDIWTDRWTHGHHTVSYPAYYVGSVNNLLNCLNVA